MSDSRKPYTRQGDHGTTTLGETADVPKTSARLTACGDTEEANLTIGAALSTGDITGEFANLLRRVQDDLAAVRTDLSVLPSEDSQKTTRIQPEHIARLEAACDRYNVESQHLSHGVPTTDVAVGLLQLAIAVTRRAERSAWTVLADTAGKTTKLPAAYLNRLSSLLTVVAALIADDNSHNIPIGACGSPQLAANFAAARTPYDTTCS